MAASPSLEGGMITYNLTDEQREQFRQLGKRVIRHFTPGDWQAVAAFTGTSDIVDSHPRLLRSLSFNDPDYAGNAHSVLFAIAQRNPNNGRIIEEYIVENYGEPGPAGDNISTAPSKSRQITFQPSVFEVPPGGVERNLIAVMSPFTPEFDVVFTHIEHAATLAGYRALRAKDIWQHSSVIQDVFSLIFRAHIVVCDFTGKNPNVFYEAGIAHTLGKHVVPITQNPQDIPFDLQHHRYLRYLGNQQGHVELSAELLKRFRTLS
jgi:hypothetical protein